MLIFSLFLPFRNPTFSLYPIAKRKIWIMPRTTRSTTAIPEVQIRIYLNPHLAILIGYVNKNIKLSWDKTFYIGIYVTIYLQKIPYDINKNNLTK